jgi:hypothetical protein
VTLLSRPARNLNIETASEPVVAPTANAGVSEQYGSNYIPRNFNISARVTQVLMQKNEIDCGLIFWHLMISRMTCILLSQKVCREMYKQPLEPGIYYENALVYIIDVLNNCHGKIFHV